MNYPNNLSLVNDPKEIVDCLTILEIAYDDLRAQFHKASIQNDIEWMREINDEMKGINDFIQAANQRLIEL